MPNKGYKQTEEHRKKVTEASRMPRSLRGGGYHDIHKWLIKTFGKANRCEFKTCKGVSKSYAYALIHGKQYEFNRDNFMMLCYSCHNSYDVTPEKRKKLSKSLTGRIRSRESVEKFIKKMHKPIQQLDLNGKLLAEYPSVGEAARATGILATSIGQCANGKPRHATAGGYKWLYLKENNLLQKEVKG